MKATWERTEFKPVQLTIESRAELEMMRWLANVGLGYASVDRYKDFCMEITELLGGVENA